MEIYVKVDEDYLKAADAYDALAAAGTEDEEEVDDPVPDKGVGVEMTEVGIEDPDLVDDVVDSGCIEDKVDILTFVLKFCLPSILSIFSYFKFRTFFAFFWYDYYYLPTLVKSTILKQQQISELQFYLYRKLI